MTGPAEATTWAVVVTFHPDPARLAALVAALQATVARVIVVDNTPGAQAVPGAGAATVIAHGRNTGVAAAQNAGIRAALDQGAGHVLLLDQDSVPATGMVTHMHECLARLEAGGARVGAIAPRYVDRKAGHDATYVRLGAMGPGRVRCGDGGQGLTGLPVDVTISSGLLMPARALNHIGLMDESLFIDHVDTDWCLRARALGYRLFVDCGAELQHELGSDGRRLWLGRWRRVPVHAPARHYYQWRNALLLARRDHVPAAWSASVLMRLAARAVLALLTGPQRFATLRMGLLGIADGLRGAGGERRSP